MAPHGRLEVVESFGRQEKTIGRKILLPFWSYFFHQPKTYPAAYTHRTKARPSRKQACCVPDFVALISPFLSCARLCCFLGRSSFPSLRHPSLRWSLGSLLLDESSCCAWTAAFQTPRNQSSPRWFLLLHELQRPRNPITAPWAVFSFDSSSSTIACCMNCSVSAASSLPASHQPHLRWRSTHPI